MSRLEVEGEEEHLTARFPALPSRGRANFFALRCWVRLHRRRSIHLTALPGGINLQKMRVIRKIYGWVLGANDGSEPH